MGYQRRVHGEFLVGQKGLLLEKMKVVAVLAGLIAATTAQICGPVPPPPPPGGIYGGYGYGGYGYNWMPSDGYGSYYADPQATSSYGYGFYGCEAYGVQCPLGEFYDYGYPGYPNPVDYEAMYGGVYGGNGGYGMTTVGGMYGGYGYGNVGVVGAQQTTIGVVGGTTLGGYGVSTMPSTVSTMPSTLGGYGTLGGVSNLASYNGGLAGAQQTTRGHA